MYEKEAAKPGWQQPLYGTKPTKSKGSKFMDLFTDSSGQQLGDVDSTLPKTLGDAMGDLDPKLATRATLATLYGLRTAIFLKNKAKKWFQKTQKQLSATQPKQEAEINSVIKDWKPLGDVYNREISQALENTKETPDPSPQPYLLNVLVQKFIVSEIDENDLRPAEHVSISDKDAQFLNKLAGQGIDTSKLRRMPADKLKELRDLLDWRIDKTPANYWGLAKKHIVHAKTPPPVSNKSYPFDLNFGGMGPAGELWRPFD